MDSAELNRMLLDRFQEVCMHLLPNGKVKGNLYLVGGIDGSAGESLQVTLTGSAAGRFIDFANKDDKGASPLWLWAKTRSKSFPEAIREAKDWLGVKDEDFGIKRHKTKTYSKPEKGGVRLTGPNTKVMDYMTLARKIDPRVVCAASIAETDDGEAIVFPFIEYDIETQKNHAVHRKYLKVDRPDGKKDSWSTKGTKRCLFGKQLINENNSELIITEGEIDALSFHSWSLPAVSVPNGVSDFEWLDIDWEWLARFEKIYVCMDMDEPGKQAAPDICKRLGLHRCFIVSLPKKDVNECLTSGLTKEDMEKCLATSKQIELDEIKRADDYTSEVCDYYTTDFSKQGWDTPWYPNLPWRVRKAELTILTGFSGHGKTIGLNQLIMHLVQQGVRVMDASLEIKPGMTLYNMTRCAMAKKQSTKEEVQACISWLNDGIFFLDCIGTVNTTRLLHAMEYARKRHGVDVFVIDSLFKCGLSSEDYGGQREFADKLTTFCNNTGAHVILVAHSRKVSSGNEYTAPTKADVSGSSDITNAAFNVIVWFRNKMKKRKLDEARQATPPDIETINAWMDENDGEIILDKQRFGEGEEAKVRTWFSSETTQFHTVPNRKTPYFQLKS